jgi:hypothetical protein
MRYVNCPCALLQVTIVRLPFHLVAVVLAEPIESAAVA